MVPPFGLGGLSLTAHLTDGWDGKADIAPENSSSEAAQTPPEAPRPGVSFPFSFGLARAAGAPRRRMPAAAAAAAAAAKSLH